MYLVENYCTHKEYIFPLKSQKVSHENFSYINAIFCYAKWYSTWHTCL